MRQPKPTPEVTEKLDRLESDLRSLQIELTNAPANNQGVQGQKEQLSLIVFSGSLDRMIAAFTLATGAAASGMEVHLFFTFWGTAALRDAQAKVKKNFLARLIDWMLPKGVSKLPLSQMNMGGGGPAMVRHLMRRKGVPSLQEMLELSAELDVQIHVCTMSMDLLGMQEEEILDYPNLEYCGVAKFLEVAAPGKMSMFI